MKGLTVRTVIIGLAVVGLAAGSVLAMPGTDQGTKDAEFAEKQWNKWGACG